MGHLAERHMASCVEVFSCPFGTPAASPVLHAPAVMMPAFGWYRKCIRKCCLWLRESRLVLQLEKVD